MEQLHPTRTNLLAKRAQIKLARQGTDLLTRKKDALLQEFFDILVHMVPLRERLVDQVREAVLGGIMTEAVLGRETLAVAALDGAPDLEIELKEINLWGVRVLDMDHTFRPRDLLSRRYSPRTESLMVDEMAADFEQVLLAMLDLAPHELRLRKLGEDIRKTNRKINALEQQLIPRLIGQATFITQALEERARDDRFRLKCMKRKIHKASA